MSDYHFDDQRRPIVIARFRGEPQDEHVSRYERALERELERGEPFIIVVDASHADPLTRAQQQEIARWVNQHRSALQERCLGIVFVFTSPVHRIVISMVLLAAPIPRQTYAVRATLAEAMAWAAERVQARSNHPAMRATMG